MRNKIILLACTFIVIVSAILTAYFLIQHDQTVKLEQYQNEDGSITIPEVLRPFMGGQEVIKLK